MTTDNVDNFQKQFVDKINNYKQLLLSGLEESEAK